MSEEQRAGIELLAAGALGWVYQWVLFAPKRVPAWVAWSALAASSAGLYWWATPTLVAQFSENWRLALFGLVGFFLMARGAGSASVGARIAPKKDSL